MGKKKLSYLIHFIICLASIGIVTILILLELLYPNISEFSDCPIYSKILLILFSLLIIAGTILSFFYRNKECTSKYELTNELFLIIVGLILLIIGLYKDTDVTNVVFIAGASMLILGLLPLFSTLIGLLKKDTIKEENDSRIVIDDKKEDKIFDKENVQNINDKNIFSKQNVLNNVLVMCTMSICAGCVLFGIILDVIVAIFYSLGKSTEKWHFKFTIIGICIALVFSLIMALIIFLIRKCQKKNVDFNEILDDKNSGECRKRNNTYEIINSSIAIALIIIGLIGDKVSKSSYHNISYTLLGFLAAIIYVIISAIIEIIINKKRK